MADTTLKMFGTQNLTLRKALLYYRDALNKLAKREDESGVSSDGSRGIIAECDGLLEALAPVPDQTDVFTPPPETFETQLPLGEKGDDELIDEKKDEKAAP